MLRVVRFLPSLFALFLVAGCGEATITFSAGAELVLSSSDLVAPWPRG